MSYMSKAPTKFEVTATAYVVLKKALKGEYEVRGGFMHGSLKPDISIIDGGQLKAVVIVDQSKYADQLKARIKYEKALGVPCIGIRGYDEAFGAANLVHAVLN